MGKICCIVIAYKSLMCKSDYKSHLEENDMFTLMYSRGKDFLWFALMPARVNVSDSIFVKALNRFVIGIYSSIVLI